MLRLLSLLLLLSSVTTALADNAGVLLLLGVGDTEPTDWSGSVTVSTGKVTEISGWRFEQGDVVKGNVGWVCKTHRQQVKAGRSNNNNIRKGAAKRAQQLGGPMNDNGVLIKLNNVDASTELKLTTPQGEATIKLADLAYGARVPLLDGKVAALRTAFSRQLSNTDTDDDFPAIAFGEGAAVFTTYQSFTPGIPRAERAKSYEEAPKDFAFLAKPTGGDQVWLTIRKGAEWSERMAVTAGGGDIYKSCVIADGSAAWIAWAERKDGHFDIFARRYADGKLGDIVNISQSPGNDVSPVGARDAKGRIWIAWMGARDNQFGIQAKHLMGDVWGDTIQVSANAANCWDPAIAADANGKVAIAWDTYEKGDYDVWFREFNDANATAPMAVANTADYEARPSLTFDATGSLWIAWEESGATWGKDWGAYDANDGIGLYRDRQIGMIVRKDDQWMQPAAPATNALPGAMAFSGARVNRGAPPVNPETPVGVDEEAFLKPAERKGEKGKHADAKGDAFNNLGRLACGPDGRVWLFCRARQNNSRGAIGSVWMTVACYYEGDHWVGPILVPHSENLIYNLPAVVVGPKAVILAHSTDYRVARMPDLQKARLPGKAGNAALNASTDPFENDVFVSMVTLPESAAPALKLEPAKNAPLDNPTPSKRTLAERAELKAIREYRSDLNGKPLRIVRGEFHRHTEISGDGGGDGPLEDMWRYAADAAQMDWLGNGDHDNGGGREYTWWLTQKTADAFHLPGTFTPMFSYERSVSYPEGHRNVVFAQRGVRTLPRLPISDRNDPKPAPDTLMLYQYLRQFGGVCASHTSVGSMGTDWRNWDPEVEPMVEIYQGARQNYEYAGCPRCPTEDDAIGGWEPAGFLNFAFAKGYRMSFQSSSDHGSTHISYAMVYTDDFSREGIVKAMKLRHTYGATDNIIADTKCQAADGSTKMMGEEFAVKGSPNIDIKLIGTAPFAKVTLIKDNVEVPLTVDGSATFTQRWTDPKPETGKTSYYYVRGEQTNGELVWASPMWIKSE